MKFSLSEASENLVHVDSCGNIFDVEGCRDLSKIVDKNGKPFLDHLEDVKKSCCLDDIECHKIAWSRCLIDISNGMPDYVSGNKQKKLMSIFLNGDVLRYNTSNNRRERKCHLCNFIVRYSNHWFILAKDLSTGSYYFVKISEVNFDCKSDTSKVKSPSKNKVSLDVYKNAFEECCLGCINLYDKHLRDGGNLPFGTFAGYYRECREIFQNP